MPTCLLLVVAAFELLEAGLNICHRDPKAQKPSLFNVWPLEAEFVSAQP